MHRLQYGYVYALAVWNTDPMLRTHTWEGALHSACITNLDYVYGAFSKISKY